MYVGLDVGGTKFIVAAADAGGRILRRTQAPTPAGLDEGLALLHEMIAEVTGGAAPVAGMGAAVGGPLDWEAGVVSPLHQPAWRNVPLKERMTSRWGCPFHVDVDTNVAALGEYHAGGERAERMLYITISTGVGGGFLVSGQIYRGAGGAHPEVGHQSVNFACSHPERVICECGAPDCLEALVSGNGIRRIYSKAAEDLSAAEWDEVAYNLGQGLRNLATIYLPDVIVLGGGVAVGGGETFVAAARRTMVERLRLVPSPGVRLSRLGYETALRGALVVAQRGLT